MFPKKRKQKEKHPSPPKILKLDVEKKYKPLTPTIGPDSPIIFMPSKSNTPLSSPTPSIPPTPTGDPIISWTTHSNNTRLEMELLEKLDSLKKSRNLSKSSTVNKPSPPNKPPPPNDTFLMPSVVNWSEVPSTSRSTSTDSNPPIDLSKLDDYANLISSDDWEDIEKILNESPENTTPINPTNPNTIVPTNIFTSVFSLEDIMSSTILNPTAFPNDDINLASSNVIIIPEATDTNTLPSTSTYIEISDYDDDQPLTSDIIFVIMKYLSDSSNNKTNLDEIIFNPVAKDIPYLKNVIDRFNSNIHNMHEGEHSNISLSIYTKDLKIICSRICKTLKEKYPLIYPAPQILKLIQSNTSNLSCLPLLEHENDLKNLISIYKKCIAEHSRKYPKKEETRISRNNIVKSHIYNIEVAYIRIYKLE